MKKEIRQTKVLTLGIKNYLYNYKKIIIILILLFTCKYINHSASNIECNINTNISKHINYVINSSRLELINNVETYISTHSVGYKVSSEYIVDVCLKYNMDISFVLAQCHIESHFGTRGIAVKTNSIFNVGTYDDGTIIYRYAHPNESIEPYIELLKDKYLINKSIEDLLKNKGFVNYQGKRYASYKLYETKLKILYRNIKKETKIDELQNIINHYNHYNII